MTSNNFKVGAQYEISPKTNIEAYVDAKIGRYQNMANGTNTVLNAANQPQFDALTYNDSKEKWFDYTYAFSGLHKFNTEGKNMAFDFEYETSNLDGLNIPLGGILIEADKIDRDKPVIVQCRSGKRSAAAIMQLEQVHGFDNLYNLKGGILAWQEAFDPNMPVY
mgnify:CR=1 FL=1